MAPVKERRQKQEGQKKSSGVITVAKPQPATGEPCSEACPTELFQVGLKQAFLLHLAQSRYKLFSSANTHAFQRDTLGKRALQLG